MTKSVWCLIPDICGAVSLYVSLPSSHYAVYSCAQFYIVIYSWSLRTSQPHHHHHRLHPVWSLSSFSTGSRERRKPGEEKRCDTNDGGPMSFCDPSEAARVSSCAGPRSSSKLLRSSSAAVRAGAWCCYREETSAEGEGSGAQRAVPQAASNEFMLGADAKDDFVVTHFRCVSLLIRASAGGGM